MKKLTGPFSSAPNNTGTFLKYNYFDLCFFVIKILRVLKINFVHFDAKTIAPDS
jgi:hypothetical protein